MATKPEGPMPPFNRKYPIWSDREQHEERSVRGSRQFVVVTSVSRLKRPVRSSRASRPRLYSRVSPARARCGVSRRLSPGAQAPDSNGIILFGCWSVTPRSSTGGDGGARTSRCGGAVARPRHLQTARRGVCWDVLVGGSRPGLVGERRRKRKGKKLTSVRMRPLPQRKIAIGLLHPTKGRNSTGRFDGARSCSSNLQRALLQEAGVRGPKCQWSVVWCTGLPLHCSNRVWNARPVRLRRNFWGRLWPGSSVWWWFWYPRPL